MNLKNNVLAALFALGVLATAPASASALLAPGSPVTEDFVIGPTAPGKWGSPVFGTGATVTYSYMASGVSCAAEGAGCTITSFAAFMPTGFGAAVSAAFASWSAVANITFVQVADGGEAFNAAGTSGDIRIGGHVFDGAFGVLAHGFFPPANGLTAAGDIHFDIAEFWKIGFGGPGFDIFQVMAHEIGHAIGLNHTGVAGSLMNPFYSEAFSGPQADDILGAQFIYGGVVGTVPEPGTLMLLGLALAVAAGAARRQTS